MLIAVLLQFFAITAESPTGDGTLHLIAGHQSLRYGQNLINWEHPPLAKLLLALPAALATEPLLPPTDAAHSLAAIPKVHERPAQLLAAVRAGRLMLLLFVSFPAVVFIFLLGHAFGGERAGWFLASTLTLSFSLLPNWSLLQTDGIATLSWVATTLLLVRLVGAPTWKLAGAAGTFWGIGLAGKFSTVLLFPPVLLALFLLPGTWRRRLGSAMVIAVAALAVPTAVYWFANRAIEPTAQSQVLGQYVDGSGSLVVGQELRPWRDRLDRVGELSPGLAQWALGFLGIRAQNQLGIYPSFAFGEVSSKGRWWYFPALFLIKMPLLLILLLAVTLKEQLRLFSWRRKAPAADPTDGPTNGPPGIPGIPIGSAASDPAEIKNESSQARRFRPWRFATWSPRLEGNCFSVSGVLILVAATFPYLAIALNSNYNIGFRHLLPVLPLLLLPLAVVVGRRPWAQWAAVLLALESLLVSPLWISATNTWVLGDRNPTRFAFSDGNLEYRQNFLTLARALEKRGIERPHILFPRLEPEIIQAWIPGAQMIEAGAPVNEPGWYLVSVLVEQYVPALLGAHGRLPPEGLWGYPAYEALARDLEVTWRDIRAGEDFGIIAATFRLYLLPGAVGTNAKLPPEPLLDTKPAAVNHQ